METAFYICLLMNHKGVDYCLVIKVQHYDNLYNNIKQLLEEQKDLQIVSEYKAFLNAVTLRSIAAVNKSPKVWVGSELVTAAGISTN
jgi:hypothetical protein